MPERSGAGDGLWWVRPGQISVTSEKHCETQVPQQRPISADLCTSAAMARTVRSQLDLHLQPPSLPKGGTALCC